MKILLSNCLLSYMQELDNVVDCLDPTKKRVFVTILAIDDGKSHKCRQIEMKEDTLQILSKINRKLPEDFRITIEVDHGIIERYLQLLNRNVTFIKNNVDYYIKDFLVCFDGNKKPNSLIVNLLEGLQFDEKSLSIIEKMYRIFVVDEEFNYSDIIDEDDYQTELHFSNILEQVERHIYTLLSNNEKVNLVAIHFTISNELFRNNRIVTL